MIYIIKCVRKKMERGKEVEEERVILAAGINLPLVIAKLQKRGFIRLTIEAKTKSEYYGE